MFTLFDFLMLLGPLLGLIVGVLVGRPYGLWAALVGAVVGLLVGYGIGRGPWIVSRLWMRKQLARSTTQQLRSRVSREHYISHLIIAELLSRGEPVESFREVIEQQLRSDSEDIRRFGKYNARLWLSEPEEAG